MSDFNIETEQLEEFSADEEINDLLEDERFDDDWADIDERQREIEASAIALVNELTAIRTALNNNQQLTDSFYQLNSTVVEQHQQIETIILRLEQLTHFLSADNLSKFIRIQKDFSTFARKLDMFEKAINDDIRQQQESREKASGIYQDLSRGWQRLEEDNKGQRRAINQLSSIQTVICLSLGTGLSAAGFMIVAFKLFISK
jgi:hypothetical protein